jgi:hypothetical protein
MSPPLESNNCGIYHTSSRSRIGRSSGNRTGRSATTYSTSRTGRSSGNRTGRSATTYSTSRTSGDILTTVNLSLYNTEMKNVTCKECNNEFMKETLIMSEEEKKILKDLSDLSEVNNDGEVHLCEDCELIQMLCDLESENVNK